MKKGEKNMSVFNVPVTIGVDEDKIAREIESEVKEKVIRNIGDKVEEIIYKEYDEYGGIYGRKKVKSDEPLRRMVERKIDDVLEKERDSIIELAAEKLADRLSRSKKVRDMASRVAEETLMEV